MLGIIGVMDEEVAMTKAQLADAQVGTRTAMDFYKRKLEGKKVVVIRSGIDKVNAAMYTQILADTYDVTGVADTGMAGSLKAEINIGDIMLSSDAIQYNMDTIGFGYEPGQTPRVETLASRTGEDPIHLAKECCPKINPDIHTFVGQAVTRDQLISGKGKRKWLTDTFGGRYTRMEEATIAQACYLNSTPFLIVRTISDKADDSATVDYPAFEAKITIHSVDPLTKIVRSI